MTDTKPKVLCVADLALVPDTLAWLQEQVDLDYQPGRKNGLTDAVGEYDAFWGHVDVPLDAAFFANGTRLKCVNTSSTGTDHIDKAAAEQHGVRVLCIKNDYGLLKQFPATAECAWMLLLACCRHLRAATASVATGRWKGEPFRGRQLFDMTLGVLGVGRLGTMTCGFGKGFRMRVLGCDLKPFQLDGVEPVDFDMLLAESDAISIHIHMIPQNYHLFNADVFGRMKQDAVLVNTSRGDIVDEAALLAALESGRLAAFGADVLHDEWREDMRTNPVVAYASTHDNVVITPHIGGCTFASIVHAREFSARKLVHYLQTGEELTMPA